MTQVQTAYLTVPQTAERLGMTADGVYKLIQRGKLDAERTSARKTKVPVEALDRYVRDQQAAVQKFRSSTPVLDPVALCEQFADQVGCSPEDWIDAWKRDEIEDTPENMGTLVRAVALRGGGRALVSRPDAHPWALAAFTDASRSRTHNR